MTKYKTSSYLFKNNIDNDYSIILFFINKISLKEKILYISL